MKFALPILILAFLFSSCSKDPVSPEYEYPKNLIEGIWAASSIMVHYPTGDSICSLLKYGAYGYAKLYNNNKFEFYFKDHRYVYDYKGTYFYKNMEDLELICIDPRFPNNPDMRFNILLNAKLKGKDTLLIKAKVYEKAGNTYNEFPATEIFIRNKV